MNSLSTLVQESEFNVCVNTTPLSLPPQGVIVVWEWEWTTIKDIDSSSEEEEVNIRDQYNPFLQSDPEPSDSDAEDIPDTLPTQTHSVTFKCVGSIHDVRRQVVLSRISKTLRDGGKVDMRIHPKPENQYDSKAITFQCHIEQEWQTIGYIVRECLDHVHEALQKKRILSVKLAWAKYLSGVLESLGTRFLCSHQHFVEWRVAPRRDS